MSRKLNLTNAALLSRAGTRAAGLFGVDESRSLRELDVAAIKPNPLQPRRHFDEEAVASLAASIDRHGLLQPICVRETQANHYQIVAGERRWRAFRSLQRATIPALVIQADDPNTLALIENLQREDLDGLETAGALYALLQERGLTHDQLGALVGKSQAYVSRMLGILELPRWILDEYAVNRHVPASAAMIVAETKSPQLQAALWEQAKAGLSVRALTQARKEGEGALFSPDSFSPGADAAPGTVDAKQPPVSAAAGKNITRTVRKTADALRGWRESGAAVVGDQRDALHHLRDEIDALLAGGVD